MNDPLFVWASWVLGRTIKAYPCARNAVTRWSHYVGQALKH